MLCFIHTLVLYTTDVAVCLQAWKDHMLLRSTLSQVEVECQAARTQVSALQRKLHALELEVEVCRFAMDTDCSLLVGTHYFLLQHTGG